VQAEIVVDMGTQNLRSEESILAYAALELQEFSRSRCWRSR